MPKSLPRPMLPPAALATLESVFGYRAFREGQEEIISVVLAGRDVFAVMPTGSGKSMCYQLPALMQDGLTVVVSPLIALMRDQVAQLTRLGVPAATLNSHSDEEEVAAAWRGLVDRSLKLLFVSPERLAVEGFAERLARAGVARLAVDEAHCVSQWGHDFRPEYRLLPTLRARLGGPPITALTATADKATRKDILNSLFEREPAVFLHSFDRPNLSLAFAPKDQPRRQIADFLVAQGKVSGIVYCAGRNRTEMLAEHLTRQGFWALSYHAGMEAGVRARHQDRFLQDDGVVMVATTAFGMGVNKPDVRFVVHADMPGSIEGYYQEIGRAGRDGLPAATLTLHGTEDMALARRRVMDKDLTPEQRRIELRRLQAMIDLCETALCRRGAVLAYFGEAKGACGGCDLCERQVALVDETVSARKLFSAIWRTRQVFGAHHIADILVGAATEMVTRRGHDQLPTFGVGSDKPKVWWLGLTRKALASGLLEETEGDRPGLQLTEEGESVLRGGRTWEIRDDGPERPRRGAKRMTREAERQATFADEPEDAVLFEMLRALRRKLAAEEKVAAYMIFADRTLVDMARLKPRNRTEFAAVNGVGQRKLEAYADVFLAEIARAGGES